MAKSVKKSNKKPTHLYQLAIIFAFLFSISLAYCLGMLYQKRIDIALFTVHMNKFEQLKQEEIKEAVKKAMPTATPTPSKKLTPTIKR